MGDYFYFVFLVVKGFYCVCSDIEFFDEVKFDINVVFVSSYRCKNSKNSDLCSVCFC